MTRQWEIAFRDIHRDLQIWIPIFEEFFLTDTGTRTISPTCRVSHLEPNDIFILYVIVHSKCIVGYLVISNIFNFIIIFNDK